jgi:hypothetical protein
MTEAGDSVHGILEVHFANMTSDLENFMRRTEEDTAKDRAGFYNPQIQALEDKIRNCDEDRERMEAAASESTIELARKEAAITHLVGLSSRLHQRVRNGKSLARSVKSWEELGTDRVILVRAYKRLYLFSRVKRTFYRRWIRKMHKKREERFHIELKSRFDKQRRAQAADTNRVLTGLEDELAVARAELEQKQQRFLELQQRLRKAFMRGVVNLNLEAMDVFNGAQFMDLIQEVQGNEAEHFDDEAAINESDDEFFVEDDSVPISVIRH